MIRMTGVTKRYPRATRPAVDDLSLAAGAGEIVGFLGPNGAGKTTTIKLLCGLLEPDAGRIEVAGVDRLLEPERAKRQLGYVPDGAPLYEQLTGFEYLAFIADVYRVPGPPRQQRVRALAERLELVEALGSRIAGYSHGMRQKLAVIAALLHDPPVWVLDEPMIGLDPRSARELKAMLAEHCARERTVFFSTHVLEVAERICHRVAIIHRGRLVAFGSIDELRRRRDEDLESIFLELTAAEAAP